MEKRFRILAMDSGGIYGLFTMMMLRELCNRGTETRLLLERGCVDLFAGTGAGAINALFLAKHEDPRDGIDEAIGFWTNPRLFRNSPFLNVVENFQGWVSILAGAASPQEKYDQTLNYWNAKRALADPMSSWNEMMGMGSWFSEPDVMTVLQSHFGALRLRDLKQNVLIPTFNWSGDPNLPAIERHWKPKIYCNFPETDPDGLMLAVDVAFTSLAWMYTLPIYNGQQGGGWFAPDPTLCAVAKVVNFVSEKLRPNDLDRRWEACTAAHVGQVDTSDPAAVKQAAKALRDRIDTFFADSTGQMEDIVYRYLLRTMADTENAPQHEVLAAAFPYYEFLEQVAKLEGDVDTEVLRHLSILSLGTGERVPYLPVETAEWGIVQWTAGMYNPALKQWIRPDQYTSFQAPVQMAREQCNWLLNDPDVSADQAPAEHRYYRLDPSLFETPVLTTNLFLRNNPAYLSALARQMEQGSVSEAARTGYDGTVGWMKAQGWFDRNSWIIRPGV
ncbi:hypothetical protein JCM17961_37920 [Endothiovibrio diazotrophicus]